MPLKPPSLPTFKLDLLVDKVAGGVHGELMPTLRYLKAWSPDTKIVLGMRDIEDSPQTMREEWKKNKTHHFLDRVSPSLPLLVSLFPCLLSHLTRFLNYVNLGALSNRYDRI